MTPVKFPGYNKIYAEDQPEYIPLPVYKKPGVEGDVTSCWQLTIKERLKILFTGKIYWSQWTFNKALQPIRPMLENPAPHSSNKK